MERRKICTIMQVVLLLFSVILSCVMPEQVFAETEKGSITITLKELGTSKNNVAFKVYQVGTWNPSNGEWNIITELTDTNVSFADLKVAADWETAANTLAACTQLAALTGKSDSTDENGTLKFSDLDLGMYLIIQEGESEYGTIAPFLSALPYVKDSKWNYDLTVKPKAELPAGGSGTENPPAGGSETENPPAGGSGTENPPTGGSGTENPPAGGSGTENPPAGGSETENPPVGGNETENPPAEESEIENPPAEGNGTESPKKNTNTSEKVVTDSSEQTGISDLQTSETDASQIVEPNDAQTSGEDVATDGSADSTNTDSATAADTVSEKTTVSSTTVVVATTTTVTAVAVAAGIVYKKGMVELLKKAVGKLFKGKRGW